ncbi:MULTISPECIES: hypothetical protein [unclassified Pseudomonas]|uniref:hypothetical protein n=1 Tax=unclassified Pseudomonas TaxID=196821 RepID=UPI00117B77BC|nr:MULTISPECIES: hypothetical protein [unclassified Pseudomonas]
MKVSVDLTPIVSWYKLSKDRARYHRNPADFSGVDVSYLWEMSDIDLVLRVSVEGEVGAGHPHLFAEKYLYDIFFIMNMSVPGSCEFLNVRFYKSADSVQVSRDVARFNLSSYNFEEGYFDCLNGKTFAPIELPLEQVNSWYQRLGLGVKQKADNQVARAIYALLHVCKSDIDINSIIWIFHALESIYTTRVGEGVPGIANRMIGLIDLDVSKKKAVTNNLRSLYNYRSAFVHGGYEVHHPMGSEVLDKRLDADRFDIYDGCRVGFNLVVLSIQKLIQKNWFGLSVTETVVGLEKP